MKYDDRDNEFRILLFYSKSLAFRCFIFYAWWRILGVWACVGSSSFWYTHLVLQHRFRVCWGWFFFAFAYFFLYSTLNASVALKCVPNEMHINTKFMEADAIVIYTLAFSSKPKEMIQEFDYIHFTSEHTTIWTVCLWVWTRARLPEKIVLTTKIYEYWKCFLWSAHFPHLAFLKPKKKLTVMHWILEFFSRKKIVRKQNM